MRGLTTLPQGPSLVTDYATRSVITYATPSAPLAGTSRFRRTAVYTRCLRCAGAPRRPTSGSELSLLIPSWHAILSDPGEFDIVLSKLTMPTWSSPQANRLNTPNTPAIRFMRASNFGASLVRNCYGLPVCSPPLVGSDGIAPASGGFYFQAFDGSVALPIAGYDYDIDWTPMSAGLAPAGMAASFAALARMETRSAVIHASVRDGSEELTAKWIERDHPCKWIEQF